MLSVGNERLLLRELLRLEIASETAKLDNGTRVDLLGPPFLGRDSQPVPEDQRLPILEFVFAKYITVFPLFDKAKPKFWPHTVQEFIQTLATKDISSSADRDEATKRRRMARSLRRAIMIMLLAGLSTNRKAESGRYKAKKRAVEDSSRSSAPMSQPRPAEEPEDPLRIVSTVIGATATAGSLFRNPTVEFIVESSINGQIFWSKRKYSDFTALYHDLAQCFPGKDFASLPHKSSNDSSVVLPSGELVDLPREDLRQGLRNYMYTLCSFPQVATSKVFYDFCARSPIALTPEEIKDIEARIELDKQRWANYEKFIELANERAAKLENYVTEIKSEILLEDALPKIFYEMKSHKRVEDMSPILQKLCEYCLIEFASLIYSTLIAKDDSPEVFSQVKRLHSLMPYKVMQGILMMSNPVFIVKKLTDLFMATPFGSRSLLQKMFMGMLSDDVRSHEKLIEELREALHDESLFTALRRYAYLDHYSREALTSESEYTHCDLVMVVIRNTPKIPSETLQKVERCHAAWQREVELETMERSEDANWYSGLKDLSKLIVRQRDKDIMREFWGEQTTMKIIRDLVNMMFDILIDMFRTANMADTLGDFEHFMTDLIHTVEKSHGKNANQMVEELIQMCQRHQNDVFKFINKVYSKEGGFFVEIVRWLTRIVNFVRAGKDGGNKLDLLGLVDSCAEQGIINIQELAKDLDDLDAWLLERKANSDAKGNDFSIETEDGKKPVIGVTDVGLTEEDVEYGLAELERDEHEEFVYQEELAMDAIAREQMRRKYKAEIEAREKRLPPRPQSMQVEALLPLFSKAIRPVLQSASTQPSDINEGFRNEKRAPSTRTGSTRSRSSSTSTARQL